jgi:hypothetical protein
MIQFWRQFKSHLLKWGNQEKWSRENVGKEHKKVILLCDNEKGN